MARLSLERLRGLVVSPLPMRGAARWHRSYRTRDLYISCISWKPYQRLSSSSAITNTKSHHNRRSHVRRYYGRSKEESYAPATEKAPPGHSTQKEAQAARADTSIAATAAQSKRHVENISRQSLPSENDFRSMPFKPFLPNSPSLR